jgi:hypothetical protein
MSPVVRQAVRLARRLRRRGQDARGLLPDESRKGQGQANGTHLPPIFRAARRDAPSLTETSSTEGYIATQ